MAVACQSCGWVPFEKKRARDAAADLGVGGLAFGLHDHLFHRVHAAVELVPGLDDMAKAAAAEELVPDQSPGSAAAALDVPGVFGATDDDAAKLRIVSLLEVDLGKLEEQFPSSSSSSSSEGGGGGFFGDQPPDDGGSGGGGGGGGW